MGCHALLQEVLLAQRLNQGPLHCRHILSSLSHRGAHMSSSSSIKDSKREEGNTFWSRTRLPTPAPECGGTSGSPQGTLDACVLIKPQRHHEVGALVYPMLLMFSCSVVSNSFVTLRAEAHKAALSLGFPRQEYWTGLPFLSRGDLSDPGIEPASPAFTGGFFNH